MRLFYVFIFFLFFFSAQTVFADCVIITTLRAGSKGVEVQCLQKKVGATIDGRFGRLTKAAVEVWQSKSGLSPDGIVGPLTRAALNRVLVNNNTDLVVPNNNNSPKPAETPKNTTKNINPNLANLDEFVKTVTGIAKEKGSSETEIELIASTLREEVINSKVNFNEEFKNMLLREASVGFNNKPSLTVFNKVFVKTFSFLGIMPSIARAETGIPFGGALTFPFYCAASGNWMITISPLPPTYVVLLSYTPGTQGFASYNIPYTNWLLGDYVSGGVCSYGTVNIPTQGTIAPMVGSSPL